MKSEGADSKLSFWLEDQGAWEERAELVLLAGSRWPISQKASTSQHVLFTNLRLGMEYRLKKKGIIDVM